MSYVVAFLAFWYDFIVGDAWEIAAAVGVFMALAWFMVHHHPELAPQFGFAFIAVVIAVMGASLWREQRGR